MAGDATLNYGTRTQYGTDTNLNSLANGAAKPLGAIDNSTNKAQGFKIELNITLNSTGVSATGTVSVFLIESLDGGTNYTDGISPTTTSDIASSVKNAPRLWVLTANANNQVVRLHADLPVQFAPPRHSLVILNNSGAAFASSGNSAWYMPLKTALP